MLMHNYDTLNEVKVLEYSRSASEVFRAFGKAFSVFLGKKQARE